MKKISKVKNTLISADYYENIELSLDYIYLGNLNRYNGLKIIDIDFNNIFNISIIMLFILIE